MREIDSLPIGDNNAPLPIYELLAYGIELDEAVAALKDYFSQGLQAYRQEDWSTARSHFETCLKIDSNDGPSKFYLEQLRLTIDSSL